MSEIVPTILAENPEIYKQQMENVQVFATRLHIDFTDGNLVKVCIWYDNEWGYSNRLIELVADIGRAINY